VRCQLLLSSLAQRQLKPLTLQFRHRLTLSQSAIRISPVSSPKNSSLESSDFSLAWLPGNEVANLPSAVARFYNGQQLTWSVMARIDGKTYSLFGVPRPADNIKPGNLVSADFSATHTTFSVTVAEVEFVLDFFSPVSPHKYARQSVPFSYLTVSTSSPNSETPSVQIYSDVDNSWVGQFGDSIQLKWGWAKSQAATEVFTLSQVGTATYSEEQDMALWGTAAYCTRENGSKLSHAVGLVDDVRKSFAADGTLGGGGEFRPGGVFAYSQDFGSIKGTSNVTFVIGNVRDPVVNSSNLLIKATRPQ
jgi:hypothetical protein